MNKSCSNENIVWNYKERSVYRTNGHNTLQCVLYTSHLQHLILNSNSKQQIKHQ